MSNINKVIGRNLSMLRKSFKLTQVELAEKFNYSDKSISKWEAGESLPSVEVLYDLANFYGVTLNDLANAEFELDKKPTERIRDRLFPAKLIITLLATSVVWLAATIIFVTIQWVCDYSYPLVFLWAVPVSCVVLIVFNSIWGKPYLLFPILSVLVWSLIACIHIQLIKYQLWLIYILGIPLQVAIILWSALIKKPKAKIKKEKPIKEKKKKEKKVENIKTQEQPLETIENEPNNHPNDDTKNEILQDEEGKENEMKQDEKDSKKSIVREDDGFGYDFIQNKKDIK